MESRVEDELQGRDSLVCFVCLHKGRDYGIVVRSQSHGQSGKGQVSLPHVLVSHLRNTTVLTHFASALQIVADTQWAALPVSFRSWDTAKHRTESPFERDFMISVRLNHLHICFLLRRLLLTRVTEPDIPTLEVAQEMLRLVVEAILLRDELVNSGTTLGWKVSTSRFDIPVHLS